MKIKKVRIFNYRSIEDSGDFYLEDKVTVLAGKNESGKTAVLEAIQDFDRNREIRKGAIPINNNNLIPRISVTFLIKEDEITDIFNKIGFKIDKSGDVEITLNKIFPKNYDFTEETYSIMNDILRVNPDDIKKGIELSTKSINLLILKNSSLGIDIEPLNFDDINTFTIQFETYIKKINDHLVKIENENVKEKINDEINKISDLLNQLKFSATLILEFFGLITKAIPNFIYFSAFEDPLQFEIPINEAKNSQSVLNFAEIAKIDLDLLQNPKYTRQDKLNHLRDRSIVITGDFLSYWNQDKIELYAGLDGENLVIGFIEEGKSQLFSLEQRSKGFQWFLSFYIQLTLFFNKIDQNILLIDEPGLYLHAKAQKDVLKVLEKHSEKMPIIFSTHSPYLLDYEKLNQIRLIFHDKKNGTRIESKIHKVSDKETLTPILTAIGLEITSGITNPDKLNNVIVEGPSDWYYLTSFKSILGINSLNFIYGCGAGKMAFVGTILHGWGCKVLYLFDNDQGKKEGTQNLTTKWLVEKTNIKSISSEKNTRIEDLFTQDDFRKVILEDESNVYKTSNSEFLAKTKKGNKILFAKKFLSDVDEKKKIISTDSKKNFQIIFEILQKEFES